MPNLASIVDSGGRSGGVRPRRGTEEKASDADLVRRMGEVVARSKEGRKAGVRADDCGAVAPPGGLGRVAARIAEMSGTRVVWARPKRAEADWIGRTAASKSLTLTLKNLTLTLKSPTLTLKGSTAMPKSLTPTPKIPMATPARATRARPRPPSRTPDPPRIYPLRPPAFPRLATRTRAS